MGSSRRLPLRAYLASLVAVFVVVAALGAAYGRFRSENNAGDAALRDASSGADLATRQIEKDLRSVQAKVARLAVDGQVSDLLGPDPPPCSIDYSGPGAFTTGHLDVIATDGTVACSSLVALVSGGYQGAGWIPNALDRATVSAPLDDGRTGRRVVMVSATIPGRGLLAAFLDLDPVGPALLANFGGPRKLEFLVTTGDGRRAIARSIDPHRWVGAPLAATPFTDAPLGPSGDPGSRRPDVDGTPRFYASASVAATGWRVYAGADRGQAVAPTRLLNPAYLAVALMMLAVVIATGFVVFRRTASLIGALIDQVRLPLDDSWREAERVGGPRELAELAGHLNQLRESLHHELDVSARGAAIVESSNDSIISWTPSGIITTWNPRSEQMYDRPAVEAIGCDMSLIVPPERIAQLRELHDQVLRGEPVQPVETQRLRRDGSLVEVSVTLSPIRDRVGTVVGLSAVGHDVTDLKAAEAEWRSLEDRLHQSQRLESLGQLAGGVAHDFNNLLAVILNYATFVAEAVPDDDALQSDLGEILSAARAAAGLTRQLLMFARREPVRPETLDLNQVVEKVRGLLSRSIGEQIDLVVNAGKELPAIRADRGQTEQILLNLAVNARDAMPDGGVLTIDTAVGAAPDHVELRPGATPGQYVQLSVSDTGTGMSREVALRAFEPFFTTKARTEGSGLGLATVYGIIAEAGGAVNVYSEEGLGTTVEVHFPAATGSMAPESAGPPPSPIQGQGETILVVEDQDAVRAVTVRMLRRNGYVVLPAASGADAISVAAEHDIDLLLTDVVMPRMAGRLLAERLVVDHPVLPVLYMSGFAQNILGPQRALDDGVALIQKPFDEVSLLQRVHEAITAEVGSVNGAAVAATR